MEFCVHGRGREWVLQGKGGTLGVSPGQSLSGRLTEHWLLPKRPHLRRMAKENPLTAGSHYCGAGGTAKLQQLCPTVHGGGGKRIPPSPGGGGVAGSEGSVMGAGERGRVSDV